MTFDDAENEGMEFEMEEGPPPEETGNRTFIIVAGILGGITLLALICIAIFATVILPRQRAQREQQVAGLTATAEFIELAIASTRTAAAEALAQAPTETTAPTTAPTATSTPVVAVPTNTSAPGQDPRTATVAALQTQLALASQTPLPTSTALPTTGFMDEGGVSALLGMAVLLIAVIFLARRLRTA